MNDTTTTVHDRLARWQLHVRAGMATDVLDLPFATAVITADLPAVFDLNLMSVTSRVPPHLLLRSIERIAATAGWDHRRIEIDHAAALAQLRQPLRDAGYDEQVLVTLALEHGRAGAISSQAHGRPRSPAAVVAVGDQVDLARSIIAQEPWATSDELVDQMVERDRRLADVAGARVVVAPPDAPVGRCLLLDDGRGLVEIDAVTTLEEHRGRGLAATIVARAIDEAERADAEHILLVADADDWPIGWYRRLGFREVGRSSTFSRAARAAE